MREQIAASGGPQERCAVVPYGVEVDLNLPKRREHVPPLRVLTIGAIGLRKGSPYVLAAAQKLRGRAIFRMLGKAAVPAPVLRSFAKAGIELCGQIPRNEVAKHLAWADVFLLPSICEGSATATYEALAASLPVIATPNTGSVVRDGLEGFVVPCNDAEAIAQRLDRLASDPTLLTELSHNAKRRAGEFTLEAYGERLVAALQQ